MCQKSLATTSHQHFASPETNWLLFCLYSGPIQLNSIWTELFSAASNLWKIRIVSCRSCFFMTIFLFRPQETINYLQGSAISVFLYLIKKEVLLARQPSNRLAAIWNWHQFVASVRTAWKIRMVVLFLLYLSGTSLWLVEISCFIFCIKDFWF